MLQRRKKDHFGCSLQKVLPGLCDQLAVCCKPKGLCDCVILCCVLFFTVHYKDSICFVGASIRYQGHVLAKELVARGLQTTVITDSAIFAMISRVNMVYEPTYFLVPVLPLSCTRIFLSLFGLMHNLLFAGYRRSSCRYGQWWCYSTYWVEYGCISCQKACCPFRGACWHSQGIWCYKSR